MPIGMMCLMTKAGSDGSYIQQAVISWHTGPHYHVIVTTVTVIQCHKSKGSVLSVRVTCHLDHTHSCGGRRTVSFTRSHTWTVDTRLLGPKHKCFGFVYGFLYESSDGLIVVVCRAAEAASSSSKSSKYRYVCVYCRAAAC
jgi:hypothetical protein